MKTIRIISNFVDIIPATKGEIQQAEDDDDDIVALSPFMIPGIVDGNGEPKFTVKNIRKQLHNFPMDACNINYNHTQDTYGVARVVEKFQSRQVVQYVARKTGETIEYPIGTAFIAVLITDPEMKKLYREGKLYAVSAEAAATEDVVRCFGLDKVVKCEKSNIIEMIESDDSTFEPIFKFVADKKESIQDLDIVKKNSNLFCDLGKDKEDFLTFGLGLLDIPPAVADAVFVEDVIEEIIQKEQQEPQSILSLFKGLFTNKKSIQHKEESVMENTVTTQSELEALITKTVATAMVSALKSAEDAKVAQKAVLDAELAVKAASDAKDATIVSLTAELAALKALQTAPVVPVPVAEVPEVAVKSEAVLDLERQLEALKQTTVVSNQLNPDTAVKGLLVTKTMEDIAGCKYKKFGN